MGYISRAMKETEQKGREGRHPGTLTERFTSQRGLFRTAATSPPESATQAAQLADPTSPRLSLFFLFLFLPLFLID
jgi:hypothetical protein